MSSATTPMGKAMGPQGKSAPKPPPPPHTGAPG